MTRGRLIAAMVALGTTAAAAAPTDTVTDLRLSYHSSSTAANGGGGSSNGHTELRERVIATTAAGSELDVDLPPATPAEARAREWRFPARVLRRADGTTTLLNTAALTARRDRWLARAKLPATMCGRWVFTWIAARIECDPQSVLAVVAAHDIAPRLPAAGVTVTDPAALAPAILTRRADGAYAAQFVVDPAHVRREAAEADVATGEILRKPVTPAAAAAAHSDDAVTGTIAIAIETDAAGHARKRTRTIRLVVTRPGGAPRTVERTEIVERIPVVAAVRR